MASAFFGASLLTGRWPAAGRERTDWRAWGAACSVFLHLLVALAIFLGWPRLLQPPPPLVETLTIDLVSEQGGPSAAAALPGPSARPEPALPTKATPRPPDPVAVAPAAMPRPRPDLVPAVTHSARPRPPRTPTPLENSLQTGQTPTGLALNDGNATGGRQSTLSVKDFLRAQIERHLNFDVPAFGQTDVVVSLHLLLDRDGVVRSADIVADPRYGTDETYRSIADSTRRAALVASPLQVPPGRFEAFHDITLDFNPRDVSQ